MERRRAPRSTSATAGRLIVRAPLPSLTHALCLALVRLANDAPELSPRILAEAVSGLFPDVPAIALRVLASRVLLLYFEAPSVADIKDAGLALHEEISAARFFGAALQAEAVALENYADRCNRGRW